MASGNFGGGREGAMLGQYDADTTQGEAALVAQLNAQNFAQAQAARQNAFNQAGQIATAQSGLGAAQMGLSNFERAGLGADVGALGQLGSLRQGQQQSLLTADQQAAQTGAYEPYGRLSQYGSGLTGLSGGVTTAPYAQPTPVSPMSQAIGTALGVGGSAYLCLGSCIPDIIPSLIGPPYLNIGLFKTFISYCLLGIQIFYRTIHLLLELYRLLVTLD